MNGDGDTETYLGDGVYCRFDGYHIRLRVPRHDAGTTVDHVVYLDAAAWKELQRNAKVWMAHWRA